MKRTRWFSKTKSPARRGVYERDYGNGGGRIDAMYCYWNGDQWSQSQSNPQMAAWYRDEMSLAQRLPWRGLSEEPK